MLAWPAFAMLKASLPQAQICALVPAYTAPLAGMCPWIGEVIVDPGAAAGKGAQRALLKEIRAADFDAALCLFSTARIAWALWRAGIPYRLAPATKWAQVLYNHRLRQRRSRSEQPEYQYNLDLIRYFLQTQNLPAVEPRAPYLRVPAEIQARMKTTLARELALGLDRPWGFLHSGSGGSAGNISLQQYADFAANLQQLRPIYWVLTAGPGEDKRAEELREMIAVRRGSAQLLPPRTGLKDFVEELACADIFVAGSTGPLHIAAAMDIPTVGFFPRRISSTALRWRPLNSEGRHLAICPAVSGDDMASIDALAAAREAHDWLAKSSF